MTPEQVAAMQQQMAAMLQPQAPVAAPVAPAAPAFSPEMMAAMMAQMNPMMGMQAAPMAMANNITGVSIPVKVETPKGVVKVQVLFGKDAATRDGVRAAMQMIEAMGLQLDAWQKDKKGNGGGW